MSNLTKRALGIPAVILLSAGMLLVMAGCRSEAEPEPVRLTAASYAGSEKCRLCHGPYLPATFHATYYQDWLSSVHGGAANVVPSDQTVVADIDDNGTDDFQEGFDLGSLAGWSAYTVGGGAASELAPALGYVSQGGIYTVTIGARVFTVEKVIGTGRGKQAYLTRMGSSLYALPVLYEVKSREWIPLTPENWYTWNDTDSNGIIDAGETLTGSVYPTAGQTPAGEGHTADCWERRCAGCHVTGLFAVGKNAQGEFVSSYIEEGIACEACHGPGELHASTLGGRGYPNRAIVNPAKLDLQTRDDVCGACHSRGRSAGAVGSDYLEFPWHSDGTPFIAGQELSDAYTIGPNDREELHTLQGTVPHHGLPGSKYGTWTTGCQNCHSAHNTTNLASIRMTVTTPFSGEKPVLLTAYSGSAGTTGLLGDATDGEYNNICEVCHTRTMFFRNDASTPVTTHYNGAKCTGCHRHEKGFLRPESIGGTDCSSCHSYLTSKMTVTTPAYMHFLEDVLATYPTANSPVRCLSCHADHDLFNPRTGGAGHGSNMRTDIAQVPAGASGYGNTDFLNTGAGGVCLSCHADSLAKTSVRPDGSTQVTAIPFEGIPADQINAYNSSLHGGSYAVLSTFSGTGVNMFAANCSKCHNDNLEPKSSVEAQAGSPKFGLHISTKRSMLGTLGLPADSAPLEEKFCYRCHSETTDSTGGTVKTVSGRDWYDAASMSSRAEGIFSIQAMTYGHKTGGYSGLHKVLEGETYNWNPASGRHVECADCHNPHAVGPSRSFNTTGIFAQPTSVSNLAAQTPLAGVWGVDASAWPAAWAAPDPATGYSRLTSAEYRWQVCLKCHSGYAYAVAPPSGQTDQALEFNPNNPGYHAVIGASKTTYPPNSSFVSPWTKDSAMTCDDCHTSSDKNGPQGPHGSTVEHILAAVFDTATGNAGTQNHLCFKCHSFNVYGEGGTAGASATGFSRGGTNLHTDHMEGSKPGAGRKVTCVDCHSAVPHGWSRRALLVTSSDPGPYNEGEAANSASDAASWPSTGGFWPKSTCNNAACH